MLKRLISWDGFTGGITLGKSYDIVEGRFFFDDEGDKRSSCMGDWKDVEEKSVDKVLVNWTGISDGITLGKTYTINKEGDRFIDDDGDQRHSGLGVWEESEESPAEDVQETTGGVMLRPGIVVATDAIDGQEEYEAVCEALIDAGADPREYDDGAYPWNNWRYVGWSQNGGIMHWDELEHFSENCDPSQITLLHAYQVVSASTASGHNTPREMLESGQIVDFADGTSAIYIDKAFDGAGAFLEGMGSHQVLTLVSYDDQLNHYRLDSKNVVAIYAQGGLGCGLAANLEASDHLGRKVLWKRDETVEVLGQKVDKAKLEAFLREQSK